MKRTIFTLALRCLAIASLALPSLGGCMAAPVDRDPMQAAVLAWLECFECKPADLQNVVKHGQRAVPTLVSVFRQGPSPATIAVIQQRLESRYAELLTARKQSGSSEPVPDLNGYLSSNLAAYTARYRGRAALALGEIGGIDARRALESHQPGQSSVVDAAVVAAKRRLKP